VSVLGAALAWPVRLYRRFLSPLKPATCRFAPTCSQNAIEALHRHGAFRGSLLAAWRLSRCQPFAREGFDPVPERMPRRFWHAGPLKPDRPERGMARSDSNQPLR
jgi:putative membrane protein insertion efficiency factor